MKIYLEFIILLNFLLDFMILYGTKRILTRKTSLIRIILGSILGSFTTIFLFINITSFLLFIIKIIFSISMILIAFGRKDFIQNIFYFYILSILVGGTIYLLDLKSYTSFYYISLITLSISIIFIFYDEISLYKEHYQNKYLVTIFYQNKKYHLEGFIDTGNRLVSPYKKESVILVNLKIKPHNIIYVPYQALNKRGIIPCIKPDRVIINEKEFSHCLVGLSKDKFSLNGMDCILPNKFKEELC